MFNIDSDCDCEIDMICSKNNVGYMYINTNEFDGKDYYLIHWYNTFNIQLKNVPNCDAIYTVHFDAQVKLYSCTKIIEYQCVLQF